ncbi:hypothetical protein E2562_023872 [Oryza meyeriana var. granulata]|uniref:Uncharacterized protein n=1 Tax=Oryza meyeriana var. granulata TaxID=110450 RepID=A0A6G1D7Z8_9ORYZ|nr:hypothetical protein E2562_023872 [Oryza meyeriana var. granulata]KAF0908252.1 hypothetical protein E2562_023872 [Oryza meyeriana var. granulata]KAF0908253.1 hypothetical protein E2562_023872 [Oryza meyeriana var. granulata]KAF0908254.1 hypothetical protein E2562_023872 [Oryza meyeriana var. granulata]
MASAIVPHIWHWTRSLPNPKHWRGESYSLQICNSPSTNQSLNLIVSWHSETQSFNLSYSICAEFHDPISLWSSHNSRLKSANSSDVGFHFLHDIICGVLRYGPCSNNKSLFRLPNVQVSEDTGKIFNLAALTLALMVCIYEAPSTLRREFIGTISMVLMSSDMKGAAKKLMLAMGSNMEEQWMRSLNLAVTNWIMESHRSGGTTVLPFMVFSCAVSASRLWKVQLYCPVVAMIMEHPAHHTKDEKLLFSLNYQHLEAMIQFIYRVTFRENWIDVVVNIDNIRCDLIQLVSETLMAKQGYGSDEKHFPSRISLQLTPLVQTDILSLTVSRSTDSPVQEVDTERGLDASLGAAPATIGITLSAHATATRTLRPWKFEHSVHGNSASMNWLLHGGAEGREVFSSEPPKLELLQPRSWFRNRYTNLGRQFTRGGGVIFAGDEYGEGVCWRMGAAAAGKAVEWEIKGRIWVTYWPNKKRTLHAETRRLEFRELLRLTIRE